MAEDPAGTLSYFEHWGNVVVYAGECGGASGLYEREQTNDTNSEDNTVTKMNIQVGNATFSATLESNTAVNEFVQMMQEAPVVMNMSDYSGFEKVGSLETDLTADNSQTNTQTGDIVLYNGNQIVIFYDSHSWSYTRLGKIEDLSGWAEALGNGNVQVTFSIMEQKY